MLSALALAVCSWNAPGVSVFTGSVPDAVNRYTDIPLAVRARLRERLEKREYDDIAEISRDRMTGQREYADLREMHFGAGRVCRTVDRDGWTEQMRERGLVYCEDRHCIIVPTVCRNVARVTRLGAVPPPPSLGLVGSDPIAGEPLIPVPTLDPSGSSPGTGPVSFIAQAASPVGGPASTPYPGGIGLVPVWTPPYASPPTVIGPLPIPEPPVWLLGLAGIATLGIHLRAGRRA